jgi:hypothetical protein
MFRKNLRLLQDGERGLSLQVREHLVPLSRCATLLQVAAARQSRRPRPLLSVIVVHKGTTMPGEGFFMCAKDLGRYGAGQDREEFVESEREAVFKYWAGKQPQTPG